MHQVSVTSFVEFAVNGNGSKEGVLRIKWPGEENNWFLSDSSTCSLNVVQFIADLQPLACYSTGHTTKTHTSRVMTHYVRFLVLKALQASQFTGVDLIHVQVLMDLQLILADAVRWRKKRRTREILGLRVQYILQAINCIVNRIVKSGESTWTLRQ